MWVSPHAYVVMFSIVLNISRLSVAVILCCLSTISGLDVICSPL